MKEYYLKLNKCKSIKEISNLFSIELLEKISYMLNICWFFTPILIFIFKQFVDDAAVSTIWLTLLYILGFIGLLNFILYLKKNNIKKFSPFLCLILYFIWCFLSCLFSSNKFYSFFGDYYLHEGLITISCYIVLFANAMIIKNSNYKNKLLKIFSYTCTFICIVTLISYHYNINFGFERTFTSVFANENHSAYYFMMGYICSIMLFIFENSRLKNLYLLLSTVILYTLILNDTLGCYLSIICIFIILIVYFIYLKKYILKIIIIILTFLFISLINLNITFKNVSSLYNDAAKIANNNSSKNEIYQVGTHRMGLWINGLKFITEKPLFGYGLDNLQERYTKTDVTDLTSRPHNEYIQIGASIGIPGLIFYLLFLIVIFCYCLMRIKTISIYTIISAFISLSYLISAFFGVSVFYTTPYLYIFLGLISSEQLHDYLKR